MMQTGGAKAESVRPRNAGWFLQILSWQNRGSSCNKLGFFVNGSTGGQ